jgi:hypothetical protein
MGSTKLHSALVGSQDIHEFKQRPYLNPTQVGRLNKPRRASEAGRRNSANWLCNFGRRSALLGKLCLLDRGVTEEGGATVS